MALPISFLHSFCIYSCPFVYSLAYFSAFACSNQIKRLFRKTFSIVFCCFANLLISFVETRSCSLMFNIAQRQLFSSTFNFLISSWVKDQVEESYIAIDSINALYNRSFNLEQISTSF